MGKYFCRNNCGKSYSTLYNCKRHQDLECGEVERKYKCPYCEYTAKRKEHLRKHIFSKKHFAKKPYIIDNSRKLPSMETKNTWNV